MEIGLPTDVKHVAHIGLDGPSANKPSWMSEFKAAPELSSAPVNSNLPEEPPATGSRESLPPLGNGNEKQKKQRRKPSISSDSPVGSPKGTERNSRRPRSSNLSMESSGQDSPGHGRRRHQKSSSRGSESSSSQASQELPDIPKRTRRKKTKDSSGGSSASSPRSKGPSSLPDIMELDS
ncbi:hypothetical protein PTKIN_Ptkin09bG0040100 [Pterospermum kingtungense]